MNRSRVPTMDWTINPYVGCSFGCTYCYARFAGRQVGRSPDEWGTFVYPKDNLGPILDRQLSRRAAAGGRLFLSSVTDPYQPIERRHELTRKALELLVKHRFRGLVSVLTKSPLVTRDVDLLRQLNCEVGLTITAPDDELTARVEAKAPRPRARLEALGALHDAGIRTWAFVGPVLPHLVDHPETLEALFAGVAATGTRDLLVAHFNAPRPVRERIAALCTDRAQRAHYRGASGEPILFEFVTELLLTPPATTT